MKKNISPDILEHGCSDSTSYLLIVIAVLHLLTIGLIATNIFLTVRRKKGIQLNIFEDVNFQHLFIVIVNYGGSPQITVPFRNNALGKNFRF